MTYCKLIIFCFFVSCVSRPPYKDYALAKETLITAKKFSANIHAGKDYSISLRLYKKASFAYKKQQYDLAQNLFKKSIKLSERAELKSRIYQQQKEDQ